MSFLCLCLAPHLGAQETAATACSPTSTTLAAGVGQSDRLDMTASPTQFGGRGLDVSASLEKARGAFCFVVSGRGGAKTLRAVTSSAASERLMDGDASISLLRSIGANKSSRRAFAAGLAFDGTLAVTRHSYADPGRTVSHFRFGVLSLGPVLRWRERVGRGFAIAQLSWPVVGAVDHPYSAVISNGAPQRLRAVSLQELRGGNFVAAYEPFPNRTMSLRAAYDASVLRYDDVRPVRSVTQTITIGVVTRLGRAAR